MSLIVVRKNRNKIWIVSDTKLTHPPPKKPEERVAFPNDSLIKIIIINPHICVAFANEIDGVDEVIRKCRQLRMNYLEMIDILFNFHVNNQARTDFILAFSFFDVNIIFEIKKLKKSEEQSSWIGSAEGFNEFQKHMNRSEGPLKKDDVFSEMKDALHKVIESGVDPGVNGFMISASNDGFFFTYDSYIKAYFPARTFNKNSRNTKDGYTVLSYGTAEEGGYNVHVFPPGPNCLTLAIHVQQGNFGVVYASNDGGLLTPTFFANVTETEFANLTKKKYNIFPHGFTSGI